MDSDISEQEEALLRRELVLARKVTDTILDGWAEDSRVLTEEYQRLVEVNSRYRETDRDKDARIKDLERQLAVYENRSSPSGRVAIPSGRIKKHNRRSPPSSS